MGPNVYNMIRSVTLNAGATKYYVFGPFSPTDLARRFVLNLVTNDATLILEEYIEFDVRIKRSYEELHADAQSLILGDQASLVPGVLSLPLAPGSWVIPLNWIASDSPMWVSVELDAGNVAGNMLGALILEGGPIDFFRGA